MRLYQRFALDHPWPADVRMVGLLGRPFCEEEVHSGSRMSLSRIINLTNGHARDIIYALILSQLAPEKDGLFLIKKLYKTPFSSWGWFGTPWYTVVQNCRRGARCGIQEFFLDVEKQDIE